MPVWLNIEDEGFFVAFDQLLAMKRESGEDVESSVRVILKDVAARGDEALFHYTQLYDNLPLTADTVRVSEIRTVWTLYVLPKSGSKPIISRKNRRIISPQMRWA
jgi:histidinol dehydrogenase